MSLLLWVGSTGQLHFVGAAILKPLELCPDWRHSAQRKGAAQRQPLFFSTSPGVLRL